FILCTVNVDLPWGDYMAMLRPYGKLCFVGVPPAPLSLPVGALIGGQKSVVGSAIGGRTVMADMLTFAAAHGVAAHIESLPMEQVNAAVHKVAANQARYRMVLHNP
ncbi:MAG TPA: alcohol dehydrogenase, partial [Gammaproteobacteria bacterium]|nr:alcohol dehydrogenase [Gammaproteobacteria bacterium]